MMELRTQIKTWDRSKGIWTVDVIPNIDANTGDQININGSYLHKDGAYIVKRREWSWNNKFMFLILYVKKV